ncbi:MAG: hypothetical protein S4CHLAM45_13320 [Chlamydiales bacterium]|nr:hypothetical protein [Chlamydiales bacterium]MCH9620596.1 hypothetical protein [Chlamydiales bacterium]MCH9623422.1 hypothetical protein [Chlamydiales bacterium]
METRELPMIVLTKQEVRYMLVKLNLRPELREVLQQILEGGNLDENWADELRDLCYDELDTCGYDEDYSLNEAGKKLEALADKLYIG